ncbi:MAG: hypothetical protein AMJ78_09350 [Omnitrophica WOR_2 bacterium SM23_29]|nr:MAG: hypothetical protein AMJ78_09350 [Omnitrophica WOR_2 bacterium SM23_29]
MKISKLQLIIIAVICVILAIIIVILSKREPQMVITPEGPAQMEKPLQPEISKYKLPKREIAPGMEKMGEWESAAPETKSVSTPTPSKKITPKKIAQEPAVPSEPDKYHKRPTPEQLNEIQQKELIIY